MTDEERRARVSTRDVNAAIRVIARLMRADEKLSRREYAHRMMRAHYSDEEAQAIMDDAPLEPWSGDAIPTARDIIAAALREAREAGTCDACRDAATPHVDLLAAAEYRLTQALNEDEPAATRGVQATLRWLATRVAARVRLEEKASA